MNKPIGAWLLARKLRYCMPCHDTGCVYDRAPEGKKHSKSRIRCTRSGDCGMWLDAMEDMLSTMRDEAQPLALRLDMAKAAAPYVHPRLASIEQVIQVDLGEPSSIIVTFVDPHGTTVNSLPL